MDSRVPPVPMGSAMAAEFRRLGHDLEEAYLCAGVLSSIHHTIPDPPVSVDARLLAHLPHDSVDRVSLLPDVLLRNVVSRLPVKDGARTAVLSRRWRGVWRSAPLVLVDSHLLLAGTAIARDDVRRVASAVTRILAAHPGPFGCVRLTSGYMEEFSDLLTRWLEILAVKGIEELVLVSRPSLLDLLPPAAFLGMATLTRLYLGLWEFPDTSGLPRATSFPNLRELGLCNVFLKTRDLDFFLDRSPVLETLCLKGKLVDLHLRLVSRSIRCVQIMGSFLEGITVVDAPCLERLILSGGWTRLQGVSGKLKIGHAPKLHMLGYLVVGNTVLEVGNTVIKAGTIASPSIMVPSVRILALEVRFGVRNEAKMIPTLLRCFPNIETLHIRSGETDQPTGKLNLKFWQESGTIDCIRSRIKLLAFHDFRGDRSELSFLKFFFGTALVLKKVVIVLANGSFTSVEDARSKVATLGSLKWASPGSSIMIAGPPDTNGGNLWSFKRASDFSLSDPYVNY